MIVSSVAIGRRIDRVIEVPDVDQLLLNVSEGETTISGSYPPSEWYLVEGVPTRIPASPEGAHWRFDHESGQWVDARPADWLQTRRAVAYLAKSDLLIALASHEVIGWDEAALASAGQIPPSLVPMMEALPPEAQAAATIKWNADGEISRMHPVILAAAYALGLSDELVDQIFGVEAE